jgi:hypothetical protein
LLRYPPLRYWYWQVYPRSDIVVFTGSLKQGYPSMPFIWVSNSI